MIANPIPWPNGAKCAACFTLDMDAESLLYLAHPQQAHTMVSAASMLRTTMPVSIVRLPRPPTPAAKPTVDSIRGQSPSPSAPTSKPISYQ